MATDFFPISIACLTVSDTRTETTDVSGKTLLQNIKDAGHVLQDKKIVKDNIYEIRAVVSNWIIDTNIQVIICTGGTGIFHTDVTVEALDVLFDKRIEGFGELFRYLSYKEIGTSTIQSRVCAGIAHNTIIFALPGSPKACKTGWSIIEEQLDKRKRSCNFVNLLHKEQLFSCQEIKT